MSTRKQIESADRQKDNNSPDDTKHQPSCETDNDDDAADRANREELERQGALNAVKEAMKAVTPKSVPPEMIKTFGGMWNDICKNMKMSRIWDPTATEEQVSEALDKLSNEATQMNHATMQKVKSGTITKAMADQHGMIAVSAIRNLLPDPSKWYRTTRRSPDEDNLSAEERYENLVKVYHFNNSFLSSTEKIISDLMPEQAEQFYVEKAKDIARAQNLPVDQFKDFTSIAQGMGTIWATTGALKSMENNGQAGSGTANGNEQNGKEQNDKEQNGEEQNGKEQNGKEQNGKEQNGQASAPTVSVGYDPNVGPSVVSFPGSFRNGREIAPPTYPGQYMDISRSLNGMFQVAVGVGATNLKAIGEIEAISNGRTGRIILNQGTISFPRFVYINEPTYQDPDVVYRCLNRDKESSPIPTIGSKIVPKLTRGVWLYIDAVCRALMPPSPPKNPVEEPARRTPVYYRVYREPTIYDTQKGSIFKTIGQRQLIREWWSKSHVIEALGEKAYKRKVALIDLAYNRNCAIIEQARIHGSDPETGRPLTDIDRQTRPWLCLSGPQGSDALVYQLLGDDSDSDSESEVLLEQPQPVYGNGVAAYPNQLHFHTPAEAAAVSAYPNQQQQLLPVYGNGVAAHPNQQQQLLPVYGNQHMQPVQAMTNGGITYLQQLGPTPTKRGPGYRTRKQQLMLDQRGPVYQNTRSAGKQGGQGYARRSRGDPMMIDGGPAYPNMGSSVGDQGDPMVGVQQT